MEVQFVVRHARLRRSVVALTQDRASRGLLDIDGRGQRSRASCMAAQAATLLFGGKTRSSGQRGMRMSAQPKTSETSEGWVKIIKNACSTRAHTNAFALV